MNYFEDFRAGEVLPLGELTVEEEEIVEFGRKYDPQPFHVDAEAARSSPYGSLIASGWHTCGLFMRLYVAAVLSKTASLGSPGVEEVRWLKPVRPGDRLRGQLTILDAKPSSTRAERGTLHIQGEMLNQDGEVVMRLAGRTMVQRRPA